MKVFIWHTEDKVLIAYANDILEARDILHRKFIQNSFELLNRGISDDLESTPAPTQVYNRMSSILNNHTYLLAEIYKRQPDIVVDEHNGVIF